MDEEARRFNRQETFAGPEGFRCAPHASVRGSPVRARNLQKSLAASRLPARQRMDAEAARAERFQVSLMSTPPNEFVQPAVPPAQTAPAVRRATVLLAEDDRSARRYFEVILQRAGYAVVV